MAVYFLRHAQTPGNAANVWVGRNNEELSVEGVAMLRNQLDKLKNIPFTGIYSSPLIRALQTAEIVKRELPSAPKIHCIDALKERDFGCFEGRPKTAENRRVMEKSACVEPLHALAVRIQPVFDQLFSTEGKHLVVSHSAVFRCLILELCYFSYPARTSLKNAEFVLLKKEKG
jgi:broad specificity phosphatase PhoE